MPWPSTSYLRKFGAGILDATSSEGFTVPRIQFLFFAGCPLAGPAQTMLERALTHCGLQAHQYEHIDILDPSTPKGIARWGSPTILVNGEDVSGHSRGDAVGCRVYKTPDQVPTVEMIARAINLRS